MEVITLNTLLRRNKQNEITRKAERKVVSIDEYRGVVLLPGRNRPNFIPTDSWNSGPLSAA